MTLTPDERLKLNQTLNAIMPEQLDLIIFTLTPPSGIIPPLPAAQGQRVAALLHWAGSPGGCGLAAVQQILDKIINVNLDITPQQLFTVQEQASTVISLKKEQERIQMSSNQIIKIFLTSSSELKEDREQFEIFINRKNKEYIQLGIFLELVIWEDFLDAMSATRLQDEYNKVISECDVFVSLFHTKVGQYTEEEFTKALENFQANQKPLIYTYFKDFPVNISQITPSIQSLLNFQKRLSERGHFYTRYKNIDELKYRFSEQLIKLIPKLTKNYDFREATIYGLAPNSTGNNVISRETIQGNTIIGTQNNYNNQNLNKSTISGGNEEVISLWKEKLASYQREEALAADPELKFRLKKLIEGCLLKIKELEN